MVFAQYVPHDVTAHETHDAVPLVSRTHAPLAPQLVPQRPQLATLRVRSVSQPFA